MDLKERQRRWEALFDNVTREDVTAWRDNFVAALRARPGPGEDGEERRAPVKPVQSLDVAAKALRTKTPEAKAMRA